MMAQSQTINALETAADSDLTTDAREEDRNTATCLTDKELAPNVCLLDNTDSLTDGGANGGHLDTYVSLHMIE